MSRFMPLAALVARAHGYRAPAPTAAPISVMALAGDPTFDPTSLSATQQARLTTMKALIDDKEGTNRDPYRIAGRGDIWWYSHDLATHVIAQSLAFRATGDLYFLDILYELGELMRGDLEYAYRDTTDGLRDGENDGYLKWLHFTSASSTQLGTDLRSDYDMRAHATSIFMTYILHKNRELTSPSGYDYGAHADYMLWYHVNHFEQKLRSRAPNRATGFPILDRPPQNAAYPEWMRWHYYMGLLTGTPAYTNEAVRMSSYFLNELRSCADTTTSRGTAYVLNRNNPLDTLSKYLMPFTYVQFAYQSLVDLYFEGFDVWADSVHLERLALQMSEFAWTGSGWAVDVGGDVSRCGIPPAAESTSQDLVVVNDFWYQNGVWGVLSAWDPAPSPIPAINESARQWALANNEDYTRVLAAEFLHEHLNGA